MDVSATSAVTSAANNGQAPASSQSAALDAGGFMLMLMAQLRNQNPLEPMQDKDLMAQVTQLNSLQELQAIKAQMQSLTLASRASYAASLIGKIVKATLDNGETIEGAVSGTSIIDDQYTLLVGEAQVPLEAVVEIQGGQTQDA